MERGERFLLLVSEEDGGGDGDVDKGEDAVPGFFLRVTPNPRLLLGFGLTTTVTGTRLATAFSKSTWAWCHLSVTFGRTSR